MFKIVKYFLIVCFVVVLAFIIITVVRKLGKEQKSKITGMFKKVVDQTAEKIKPLKNAKKIYNILDPIFGKKKMDDSESPLSGNNIANDM
jgi:hypothetical protein